MSPRPKGNRAIQISYERRDLSDDEFSLSK